jgi:hypothetical protein
MLKIAYVCLWLHKQKRDIYLRKNWYANLNTYRTFKNIKADAKILYSGMVVDNEILELYCPGRLE